MSSSALPSDIYQMTPSVRLIYNKPYFMAGLPQIIQILNIITLPLCALFSLFFIFFLFWREGRHEFVESELLFDSFFVSFVLALILGRLFDFEVNFNNYQSLWHLIFINSNTGFSFFGALVGVVIANLLLFRKRKNYFWLFLDFASPGLALGSSIFSLGIGLKAAIANIKTGNFWIDFYWAVAMFLLFFVLKRLQAKKRFVGFFACFYFCGVSLFYIVINFLTVGFPKAGIFPFPLLLSFGVLAFGAVSWFRLGHRNFKGDLRAILAFVLLLLFKIWRIMTNFHEADRLARSIIFLPYYLARSLWFLVKLLSEEIARGFLDFVHAFGFKR